MTARSPFIVTVHGPVPDQAPLHPANDEPPAAVGVSVKVCPVVSGLVHATAQVKPVSLAIVPLPVPA